MKNLQMPPQVEEKLNGFSKAGFNKTTCNDHPKDNERWNIFVIASHTNKVKLDMSNLRQRLIDDAWSEDCAIRLCNDYENKLELLTLYDSLLTK